MTGRQTFQRAFSSIFILLLSIAVFGPRGSAAARLAVFTYANGVRIAAAVEIPIFKVNTIQVNGDGTTALTSVFDGIYERQTPQEDTFKGKPRFTSLSEKNQTVLEQFGATGGFYAYNPTRAFGSDLNQNAVLDGPSAQRLACQFLLNHANQLPLPGNLVVNGLSVRCANDFVGNPLYRVSTETLSGQSIDPKTQTTNTSLRLMVTVPIAIHDLQTNANFPLGGPGGHISFIFDNTAIGAGGPSLDSGIVGLQALAMPIYGRSFDVTKYVPARDPALAKAQVLAQVKAAFPTATNINIPDPAFAYFVSDAGSSQSGMEPDLTFSGITLDVNGATLALKDLTVPGSETGPGGLGPTVTILSPVNGTVYLPAQKASLIGQVSDGTPPFNYEWQMGDGSVRGSGTLNQAGKTQEILTSLTLPASKGEQSNTTVTLAVTDADGITRQSTISLLSPYDTFLSAIYKSYTPAAAAVGLTSPTPQINPMGGGGYSFGVEYGSDYPPYGPGGPDLGGVPPDANGLSSSLMSLGWPRIFNWYNANSWEKDWRDCTLGGVDCSWGVDRADFVYYSGHGSYGGISVPSNTHDTNWADGTNARFQNARWIGFSSCLTLRAQWPTPGSEPIRKWFNAFQGAHMLLGFNSLMADIAFGAPLVDNMRMPTFLGIPFPWAQRTIAEAWVQTAFQMNAGKPAYIYATSASYNPVGNKLPSIGDPIMPRPYPVNWYYWVWWNE